LVIVNIIPAKLQRLLIFNNFYETFYWFLWLYHYWLLRGFLLILWLLLTFMRLFTYFMTTIANLIDFYWFFYKSTAPTRVYVLIMATNLPQIYTKCGIKFWRISVKIIEKCGERWKKLKEHVEIVKLYQKSINFPFLLKIGYLTNLLTQNQ
jgi:hypothetical protein